MSRIDEDRAAWERGKIRGSSGEKRKQATELEQERDLARRTETEKIARLRALRLAAGEQTTSTAEPSKKAAPKRRATRKTPT